MCIADLFYKLTTEPILGVYTIIVENGLAIKTFVVDEAVLPRFEVIISEPDLIYCGFPTFTVKVCGKYTYGKGVRGRLELVLCRKLDWSSSEENCITMCGTTDETGCCEIEIKTSQLNINNPDITYLNVVIRADLIEDGTGIQFSVTKEVSISCVDVILSFEEMDSFYKGGYPYNITLAVHNVLGISVDAILLSIEVTFKNHECFIDEITDETGRAHFSLDTLDWNGQVKIRGFIKNITTADVTQYVRPYYSAALSSIRLEPISGIIPCGQEVHIRVRYNIIRSEMRKSCRIIRFYYLVVGKNGIMLHGQITIDKILPIVSLCGFITVPITFTSEFGPAPKMLGFLVLKDGAVTADRLFFNVEKCFPNWASLKFSRKVVLPKDRVVLTVCSSAGSVCAIRAVDKSVQINNEDKELTPETVFELFQDSVRGGYPDIVSEDPNPFDCWWPWYFNRQWRNDFVDMATLCQEVGLKILTNTQIKQPPKKPKPCFFPEIVVQLLQISSAERPQEMKPEAPIPDSTDVVRKYFPEDWLWFFVFIDNSNNSSIPVIAPDTITQFNARAFCVGDIGFVLSPEVSLTVYKPFFVDLTLPRSIVQGEILVLKATVFNYFEHCIEAQITLISSTNFTVQGCQQQCVNSSCICANETVTFTWNITATTIGVIEINVRVEAVASDESCRGRPILVPPEGNIDLLQRQLLVKARGVRKEVAENVYICLNDTVSRIEKSFAIVLPKVFVEKSESAEVNVMGNALGSTLKNLDKLIVAPYGCGEQNLLTMVPEVCALQYLEATGELSATLRNTAIGYLQDGYARELQYKRTDGSYSAFGMSDADGSTWLTACVIVCFIPSSEYIYIDQTVINQALSWLRAQQQQDGSFISRGMLYHTSMKGGVEDDISLCGYVTSAFLEAGIPATDPTVAQALSCLRNEVLNLTNTYTMALLAYTFALADDLENKQILLNQLYLSAVSSGGDLYWTYFLQNYQATASVELTAYCLLALVTGSVISANDLLKAYQIVNWLVKQQSPQGGYSSTQDTVVTIKALVRYMMLTSSPTSSLVITVYTGSRVVVTFKITQTNRLLLQTSPLPNIPGKYWVVIEGNGCVLFQRVTRYNLDPVKVPSAFTIDVNIVCDWKTFIFTLTITISYIGQRNVTNMVLIEVEMLSGFTISGNPEEKLLELDVVKKCNFRNGILIIYLQECFLEQEYEFTFSIQQETSVLGLKGATVKVYDYYLLDENAVTSYNACNR
ncbi:alpha-2-macroglobulin-like protein 1 [Anomaloglossus baeobatrachus]|uniref:alpha-2-macroglobulin-like protein 1 n=1 Tax=Anomaloglossus baeobatrachus TaxID=238106 RepID=UPI003F5014E3